MTSFSLFKFMALYSIAEFVSVAVLYSVSHCGRVLIASCHVTHFLPCRLSQILETSSSSLST